MTCDLSVVTIGNFDGLHLGHRALLKAADELCRRSGCGVKRIMLTFDPHPEQFFRRDDFQLIYPLEIKRRLAGETGMVDEMKVIPFQEIREMDPDSFLHQVLIRECRAAWVVVGDNFRFGKGGSGSAEDLRRLCLNAGIQCIVVPGVMKEGRMISSTWIKQLLKEGKAEKAGELLGRPYFLEGSVLSGKKLGRTMDTPTLNVSVQEECLVPRCGVYASITHIKGKTYQGITNVGDNPTFREEKVHSETFLFGCSEDLYGETARIELLDFVRPEQRFSSVSELKGNIQADIDKVKDYFQSHDFSESHEK